MSVPDVHTEPDLRFITSAHALLCARAQKRQQLTLAMVHSRNVRFYVIYHLGLGH